MISGLKSDEKSLPQPLLLYLTIFVDKRGINNEDAARESTELECYLWIRKQFNDRRAKGLLTGA